MDPVASFNMIGAAMEQAFQGQYSKKKYAHEINRKFFKSIICSAWCDCSDNFEQKKLIKNYEDFISASEKNS